PALAQRRLRLRVGFRQWPGQALRAGLVPAGAVLRRSRGLDADVGRFDGRATHSAGFPLAGWASAAIMASHRTIFKRLWSRRVASYLVAGARREARQPAAPIAFRRRTASSAIRSPCPAWM